MTGIRKGTVYLFFGWLIQLIAGYVLNIALARILGPEQYGLYGVVMSILLWIELGVIVGLPTAIQKFIPGHENRASDILDRALRLQLILIAVFFGISYLASSWIGTGLRDGRIGTLLRIAFCDIWFFGIYFLFVSFQNGFQRFGHQAFLLGFYYIVRLVWMVGLMVWTKSVAGALVGNILASLFGLALGILFVKPIIPPRTIHSYPAKPLVRFVAPVILYVLAVNLLLNFDLWMTKYYLGTVAAAYYVAASMIARVPHYLLYAVSTAVFPALSQALSEGDEARVQRTVGSAYRIMLAVTLPLCLLTLAYSKEVVVLFYGERYSGAAPILTVLIWGMSLLAIFTLSTTVINADNRPTLSLWISGASAIFDILLNVFFIPVLGAVGAALSTTLAILTATVVAGVLVFRRFQIFIAWRSLGRIGLAGMSMYGASCLLQPSGWAVIPIGGMLLAFYVVVLLVTGEFRLEDFHFPSS